MISTIAIPNVAVQSLEKGESVCSDLLVLIEKFSRKSDWIGTNIPGTTGSSISVLESNLLPPEAQMRRKLAGTCEGEIAPESQRGAILESWAHQTQEAFIECLPCD